MQEATPRLVQNAIDYFTLEAKQTWLPQVSTYCAMAAEVLQEHDARVRVCEAAEALLQENPYNQSNAVRDELRAALASLKGGA